MASVELRNLEKTFGDGTPVVRGVSLTVSSGQFCVLLGPSGCGKSTTLRMVAGLEDITGGDILIDGTRVNDMVPKDRDVAMVFQNYALYPHLTVRENIAFPLVMKGVAKETRGERVREVAAMLELSELLDRRPAQLSGGQRQRVAMARAIVRKPKVFLFDEPLSNLDARLRAQTRRELKNLHARVKITSLYVTHDQEEAMSLADMVAVMAKGRLQQCASPLDLFLRPANRFVAGFVGTPAMNFLEAAVGAATRSGREIKVGQATMRLPEHAPQGSCVMGVRPTGLALAASGSVINETVDPLLAAGGFAGVIDGVVESVDLLGEVSDVSVRTLAGTVLVRAKTERWIVVGVSCAVGVPATSIYLFESGDSGACVWSGTQGLVTDRSLGSIAKNLGTTDPRLMAQAIRHEVVTPVA